MKTLATLLVLVSATGAQAQTSEAILQRASTAYSAMRTVRAEFQQSITNPLTGTNAISRGVMLRKAPNLLSVNFTDPQGDRVVSDGKSVWVYLPSSAPNQVIRLPATGKSALAMVEPGELFLSSPATRYNMTSNANAIVAGRQSKVVSLVPKKPNGIFSRAKVWIDAEDYSVRQFEIVDANGLTRLVTITKLEPNAAVSPSEFKFTPPKNARILDSGSYPGG